MMGVVIFSAAQARYIAANKVFASIHDMSTLVETRTLGEALEKCPPQLLLLRGPAGSGKSTVTKRVVELLRSAGRSVAYLEQDHFRHTVLTTAAPNNRSASTAMLAAAADAALAQGCDTLVEGICNWSYCAEHLDPLLLSAAASDMTMTQHVYKRSDRHLFYFDVSLDETIRRHKTREKAATISPTKLRKWYKSASSTGHTFETRLSETNTVEQSVSAILRVAFGVSEGIESESIQTVGGAGPAALLQQETTDAQKKEKEASKKPGSTGVVGPMTSRRLTVTFLASTAQERTEDCKTEEEALAIIQDPASRTSFRVAINRRSEKPGLAILQAIQKRMQGGASAGDANFLAVYCFPAGVPAQTLCDRMFDKTRVSPGEEIRRVHLSQLSLMPSKLGKTPDNHRAQLKIWQSATGWHPPNYTGHQPLWINSNYQVEEGSSTFLSIAYNFSPSSHPDLTVPCIFKKGDGTLL